ncbi:Rieske 2Fe-2S family protein [Kushneria sinocarnis]|uniref:Rieske 2Fe-2S family protein n=1 Tax=Kushneria sinocarnis TaxID=595502 RepID=A0A420WYZ8_9GAMM|nr:aromatic ring-hydroxylating dioxygenase subunit alpha [Kushneria sinocarnis]RKR06568.1 Rieske 2Fe-2S family protein [Kushneria sinocarnis]
MHSLVRLPEDDVRQQTRHAVREMLGRRDPQLSLEQPFYNDQRVFELEMETLFRSEWLFAAMGCEMPKKGNFVTLDIGDNPIVIVRSGDGALHGFHNVCRHRSSRLCLHEKGKVAKLVCPYHQWTYELDGRLLFAGQDMGGDFDLGAYGLQPIHVREAGGFVFVCLADTPPPIEDFLSTLEHYMAPYEMDNARVAVQSDIVEEANWKLVIENNRECYHCSGAHPELLASLQEFDDTDDPRASDAYRDLVRRQQATWEACGVPWQLTRLDRRNRLTRTPLTEGIVSMTMDGKVGCRKLMGQLTTPDLGSLRILHLPNSWNHCLGDHLITFRVLPLGPQRTLVTTKWIVRGDAVEGVDYDPARLREVWDATNDQDRRLAEENQRGINSMAYRPGPYSPTYEFGVIDFLQWYGERMLTHLATEEADDPVTEEPALSLARG